MLEKLLADLQNTPDEERSVREMHDEMCDLAAYIARLRGNNRRPVRVVTKILQRRHQRLTSQLLRIQAGGRFLQNRIQSQS